MLMTINRLQEMLQLLQQMQRHVEELLGHQETQEAELERLRQRVKLLEEERQRYLTSAYALALDHCTREELEKLSLDNYVVPLHELLAKLEHEVGRGKHAG